jgi:hypothetical protein
MAGHRGYRIGWLPAIRAERTEIHRIGPPQEVYDYQTGKLIGHVGPRGRRIPLAADSAAEAAASRMDAESLDY